MTPLPDECVRQHREPQFGVKEQQSEVVFLNPSLLEVHQIEVDGCVFKDSDVKRCDWLVNVNGTNTSIFVELKGSDIEGAFVQLAQTQERLAEVVKRNRIWIISYSGSPRFNTTIQNLKLRARSEHDRARLSVEGSPYLHNL